MSYDVNSGNSLRVDRRNIWLNTVESKLNDIFIVFFLGIYLSGQKVQLEYVDGILGIKCANKIPFLLNKSFE